VAAADNADGQQRVCGRRKKRTPDKGRFVAWNPNFNHLPLTAV